MNKISGIRLVASDLDGTLLDPEGKLSDSFFSVFRKLKAANIWFAAASGRQLFNLQKVFDKIKDEIIFIAENGSYIVYKGHEIHVEALKERTVHKLINIARGIAGVQIVLCGKKTAYIESDAPEFVNPLNQYYEKIEKVENLLDVKDDQFLKVTVCDLSGAEKNSYPYFRNMRRSVQVKVSGNIWLDISAKEANKGKALETIQNMYHITAAQTMVFGDWLNDLEMIHRAYYSYAMENAHPKLKRAARFIAKGNDEGGVVEILKRLLACRSANPIPTACMPGNSSFS